MKYISFLLRQRHTISVGILSLFPLSHPINPFPCSGDEWRIYKSHIDVITNETTLPHLTFETIWWIQEKNKKIWRLKSITIRNAFIPNTLIVLFFIFFHKFAHHFYWLSLFNLFTCSKNVSLFFKAFSVSNVMSMVFVSAECRCSDNPVWTKENSNFVTSTKRQNSFDQHTNNTSKYLIVLEIKLEVIHCTKSVPHSSKTCQISTIHNNRWAKWKMKCSKRNEIKTNTTKTGHKQWYWLNRISNECK